MSEFSEKEFSEMDVLIDIKEEKKTNQTIFSQMFHTSFYKESWKRVVKHPLTKYYISCDILVTVVFAIIRSRFLIWISEGQGKFIPYLILFEMISLFTNSIVLNWLGLKIGAKTTNDFIADTNKLYHKMHPEQRANKTAFGAKEKKDSARMSFLMITDWGLPTLIGLVGSGLSVIMTFYLKKMIVQFLFCSSVAGLFYYFYIKKKQQSFTELDKEVRKEVQRIAELVRLNLVAFQGGEISDQIISEMEIEIENKRILIRKKWMFIGTLVKFVNDVISATIVIISTSNLTEYILYYLKLSYSKPDKLQMFNAGEYMLFSMVLIQWSNSISSMINFMTQLNSMKSDYEIFVDYWKDVEFSEIPEKKEITENLKITGYYIKRGDVEFKFENPQLEIPYCIGKKYLVLGPTGHGKSTFINAILGKSNGCEMNIGTPSNYYWQTADMFQAIREKMPSSKITIRDWMKKEQDNELIMKILLITFEKKKLDEILDSFAKRCQKSEKEKNKNLHPFDVEINEEISGGQKTALCLATRCYEIEKFNKKILILDEPEQGLGRRAVKVLNNIYKAYPDITIINSTHLYKFELDSLDCKFDMIFWIENGIVKTYNSLKDMDFLDSLEYE
jgi:ABC-type multidrug transport system ATPase subunit